MLEDLLLRNWQHISVYRAHGVSVHVHIKNTAVYSVFKIVFLTVCTNYTVQCICSGADPGEVKWVNFHPPFSERPSFFFFFLSPQTSFGSIT